MRARCSLLAVACLLLGGCRGAERRDARTPQPGSRAATCATVTAHLVSFGEALETASVDAKTRALTYAGRLELLLSFDAAASDLDGELAVLRGPGELGDLVKRARDALDKSTHFARSEHDALEKHAKELAPLAKETQQAWSALRATCDTKRAPPDCAGVRDAVGKFDAAETPAQHERAVAELTSLRLLSPNVAKARDRAVAASRAIQGASKTRTDASASLPKRWSSVQKDLSGAMNGLVDACRGEAPAGHPIVAAEKPDPRKLTVLVHVKPAAGVERALLSLAAATKDDDEKEFYKARAEGAFGSGFVLVTKTDDGSPDVLVVTNRHVVDLGDRANLELADGTSLGQADIVYASPTYDLAILRPKTKLPMNEGFGFSHVPARDQQTVIATGFPGLVGRPSYQTTRGYVSNQGFKLDDGARPLTYLQHTAPIDPGSSGGPLTDETGRVLGVNTLKAVS